MGGTDEKLGKEQKEQASGINGSRTSQTGFNINNAALLSKHSYHQQDSSFANQEASKRDCFKPASRAHKQHKASLLSLSNQSSASSVLGWISACPRCWTHTHDVVLYRDFFCLLQGRKVGQLQQAWSPSALGQACRAQGTQSPPAAQTWEQPQPAAGRHRCCGGCPLLPSSAARGNFGCQKHRDCSTMLLCPSKADLTSSISSTDPMSGQHRWLSAHPQLLAPKASSARPPSAHGTSRGERPARTAFAFRGARGDVRLQLPPPRTPREQGDVLTASCRNATHPQPLHRRHASALQ